MMSEKLKPCPFCGSSAFMETGPFRNVWVQCSNVECKGFINTFRPESKQGEAAEIWNTRPREEGLEAALSEAHTKIASLCAGQAIVIQCEPQMNAEHKWEFLDISAFKEEAIKSRLRELGWADPERVNALEARIKLLEGLLNKSQYLLSKFTMYVSSDDIITPDIWHELFNHQENMEALRGETSEEAE